MLNQFKFLNQQNNQIIMVYKAQLQTQSACLYFRECLKMWL
jgi:hypothetical protein